MIDLSKAISINSFNDLKAHHASEALGHVRIMADDGAVLTISHINLTEIATDMFDF